MLINKEEFTRIMIKVNQVFEDEDLSSQETELILRELTRFNNLIIRQKEDEAVRLSKVAKMLGLEKVFDKIKKGENENAKN